ncbi:MAG: hypothetical protein RLZZ192_444 [Pseudomonadota bacterium]|jgi:hypothetical protein
MTTLKDQTHEQEEAQILTLAKLAGLDVALKEHRQDVFTAARTALKVQKIFAGPACNTTEPWPTMKVKP